MTLRTLKATVTLFLASVIASAQPQPAQFTDPANLRGERVKPRDGRELPIDQGARGLEQMLRKLNTRASLMLIVAHPDDEDGGMLTYYSRGLGARVAVLTLTRGEGGQNAMTGDFEDALGLLRTQELLSADRYLGVDQFFGTEVDFGFSKTKEEAFKKWTHERVLYDAVRSIRLYRPLVIAAVFIGGVTDGHGQHQVSGQIAQEAFKAAADPTVFPDMIAEGILPWQALKVYARVPMQSISDKGLFDYATGKYTAPRFENYVTGEITTTVPSSDVIVHEGTTDPILSDNPAEDGSAPPRTPALTYVQFARIGLGMQKSQIGGGVRVPPAGAFDVAYHLYGSALCSSPTHIKDCHPERSAQRAVEGSAVLPAASRSPEPSTSKTELPSFFDGIDTSIEGIADLAPSAKGNIALVLKSNLIGIAHSLAEAQLDLKPNHPELAAHRLSEALKLTEMAIANIESFKPEWLPLDQKQNVLHELRVKRVQLNDVLVLALSLRIDATAAVPAVSVQSTVAVHTSLKTESSERIPFFTEELQTVDGVLQRGPLSDGDPVVTHARPWDEVLTMKPALTKTETRPYFFRDNIEQPIYQLRNASLRNAPTTPRALVAWGNLTYNGTDIRLGSVVEAQNQPIQFITSLNVSVSPQAEIIPSLSKSFSILLTATPVDKIIGILASFSGQSCCFVQATAKPDHGYLPPTSSLTLPLNGNQPVTVDASAVDTDKHSYTEGYRPIGYGDLPRTNYYTPATVRIVPVDLNLPTKKKIAYLPGTGDAVPEALASINLKPDILTVADLKPAKLAQYDTVILGVRTYAAHPDLHGAPTQALLDYARNGGNVLLQYQSADFTAADAPYPLSLGSNEKVVDETDPVQLLLNPKDAASILLATPNKITSADFNNWVEERGHGFLGSWDPHYTALTETHDPDQDPQRGGLITTSLGKGRWTYCAFALYRQLPEAVPGAYRLFVNLISPETAKN